MTLPQTLTAQETEIIKQTETFVQLLLLKESTGHDWHHILRVRSMARLLADDEEADAFLIEMASLLHDVDDPKLTGKPDSRQTDDFLASLNIFSAQKDTILDIIGNLSFSSHLDGKTETTTEGKIVQDADRLDALGAIGIARTFAYGGSKHRPIYAGVADDESSIAHFYQKLLKLPDLMNTPIAKEIAKERVKFMNRYLKEFFTEWNLENQ
jgi:uncharacterized protein